MTLVEDAGGSQDALASALASIQLAKRREEAVSELLAHLRATETSAAIALLAGLSQSVRLYEDDVPLARPYWQQQYAGGRTEPRSLDFDVLRQAASSPTASTLVRAHVGNLLYSFRTNEMVIGAASSDAYLELARDAQLDRIEQYALAAKGYDVARRLHDDGREDDARARLLAIADEALAATTSEHPEGGTVLRTLEYYVFRGGARTEADLRLQQALLLFEGDWHLRREIAVFLGSLQDTKEEADAIIAEQLRALIAGANSREAFLKESLLRQVLATARAQGLRDVAGEASSALSQIGPQDYDFKATEFSWKLDKKTRAEVKGFFASLEEASPEEAWATWASQIPLFLPSDQRPPYEFQISDRIATLTEVSRAGHVSFQARSDEDIVRYRHHEEDRRLYEFQFQLVIGPGLLVLLNRPECVAVLTQRLMESPVFTAIGGERALRAFTAFHDGDVEPTGYVLPTVEAAIRVLAIQAHVSIYNPDGAANVFKTLGGLIRDLVPSLGGAAQLGRFWEFALTDQLGFNIRNEYLHGFLDQLTHVDAVVVLQVIAQLLFLLRFQPVEASDDVPGEAP